MHISKVLDMGSDKNVILIYFTWGGHKNMKQISDLICLLEGDIKI